MKKIYYYFIIILFCSIVLGLTISNFDSQSDSFNVTFTGNQNSTINLTIYKDANITNATFSISGNNIQINLSDYSSNNSLSLTSSENARDFYISPDGLRLYLTNGTYLQQYNCSDSWNISSCIDTGSLLDIETELDTFPNVFFSGVYFKEDGTEFWVYGSTQRRVYGFNCSTPWDLSTCTDQAETIGMSTYREGFYVSPDGKNVYTTDLENNLLVQQTCVNSWSISSCWDYPLGSSIPMQSDSSTDIFWEEDGREMYELRSPISGDYIIYKYSCSKAWNITTCDYTNNYINITGDEYPEYLFFKDDMTNLYLISKTNDKLYQYSNEGYTGTHPTNPYISLNNTQIWNYTEEFNTSEQTSDFSSTLNMALNSGNCDCEGCSLSGNNCTIPFTFHSDTIGVLEVSNLNITWNESINPNVTIVQPIGEKDSTNISYNVSVTDNHLLNTCKYWVTRGASLEVSNTTVTCSDSTTGTLYVSSVGTNYTFHFYAEDYSGNINISTSNFSTSSGAVIVEPPSGGGGSTIIQDSERGWIIEVADGIAVYEIVMAQGTTRNLDIDFENLGSSSKTITLSCEDVTGDICQYVTFDRPTFVLELLRDIPQSVDFKISLPEDIEKGNYQFNIKATDESNNQGAITVFLNVGNAGLPNLFFARLGSSTSFGVPYLLIFFPALILGFIAFARIFKDVNGRAVFTILASGVVSISLVFIL